MIRPGTIISHFEVVEKLGAGRMGTVYLAEDLEHDRQVALKFLPPQLDADGETHRRFIQEAMAASELNHPNVYTIHEIGRTEAGPGEPGVVQKFIAMEYYEGQTLRERLESGSLPREQALDVARQIAEGLSAASEKDIIHGDLKPANIFITASGRVVILDFGLAKLAGWLDLTKKGSAPAAAYYMSPEQVRGNPVDHRSDVWSLGVVLYEMLAGQRPFAGEYERAVSYAILNADPPPLAGESAFVEGIVRSCLHKSPRERTDSASTLAARLATAGS